MFKKIALFFTVFFMLFCLSLNSPVYADNENPKIYAPSAILMDMDTGKILYEKNINEKMYPASLTKVLTAIIVLENCGLEEIATVSYDAVMSVDFGYVSANLQIGEELTVEQLLNLLLVSSSNDAANVLAEYMSGSFSEFAVLMNQKALEIGCKNTHFVNPSGAHDENHYSTAYDLALIGRYAMNIPKFRELARKTFYQLPATNKYAKDDRIYTTTNELIVSNSNDRDDNYYYKYATGIKTGFTTPAGNCLMASCDKDDFSLISVVLKDGQTKEGLSARYIDTKNLFEYGYANYSLKQLAKRGSVIQTINIQNATSETKRLDLIIDDDIYATVAAANLNNSIVPKIELNENLKAPILKNAIVGKIYYEADGITYSANLLANNDVKASNLLIKFILLFLLVVFLIGFIRIKNNINKKKRLKKIKNL